MAASAAFLFSAPPSAGEGHGPIGQSPAVRYASLGRPGQSRSHDAVLVRESRHRLLFGILDAHGEGPVARQTAATALAYLRAADVTMGLVSLVRGLHLLLQGTAGAGATLGLLCGTQLFAVRIGGVALLRTGGSALNLARSPGTLGLQLDRPRVESITVAPGERLVLISSEASFDAEASLLPALQPSRLSGLEAAASCQVILQQALGDDREATVLVLDLD